MPDDKREIENQTEKLNQVVEDKEMTWHAKQPDQLYVVIITLKKEIEIKVKCQK